MKIKAAFGLLFLSLTLVFCGPNTSSRFIELSGPYLGQNPPGENAEFFAPGLLSAGGHETKITFTPDGMEFSYSISTSGWEYLADPRGPFRKAFMMYSRMGNKGWSEPAEFPFSPPRMEGYPSFSPDGMKLFFNSNRNRTDPPEKSFTAMSYVERENGGWSEPRMIDFGENYQGGHGVSPTVAANGNLYFALWPTNEKGILNVSRYQDGNYMPPEPLSDVISDFGGNHPHIAPDESYILFDSEYPSNSDRPNDIFICFRSKDGEWLEPQNLGDRVNSHYDERRPFVSFDGKYLFFASTRINPDIPERPITLLELQRLTDVHQNGYQHIFWVDAKVIEDLRPKY